MFIENTDAFYSWLTTSLVRLCDADPAALAKYVMALVKKDKPEKELKEFCSDQLDVFLSKQTRPFVELLFETLKSKSYLQSNVVPNSTLLPVPATAAPFVAVAPVDVMVTSAATMRNELDSLLDSDISEKTDKKARSPSSEFEARKRLRRRSRSTSSSSCSSKKSVRSGNRSFRDSDGRERRHSRRSPPSRRYSSRRRTSRRRTSLSSEREHSDSHKSRERDRKMRRDRRRGNTHIMCSDRLRSRSGSVLSDRNHSLSCSSSRSRSRSWSRSRTRSKDGHSHSESRSHDKDTSQQQHHLDPHGDTDYRVGHPAPNSVLSSVTQPDLSKQKSSRRIPKRCKDYDEKGYCMQGELCLYDHGADPLVVEDVTVLNFGAPSSQAPSLLTPEPYNPEAPGIYQPKTDQMGVWSTSGPPHLAAPPPGSGLPLPSRMAGLSPFTPNDPLPAFHGTKIPRTRELIGVPTLDTTTVVSMSTVNNVKTLPVNDTPPAAFLGGAQTNTTHVTKTVSSVCPVQKETFAKRGRTFDPSRLGVRRPIGKKNEKNRCTLELRKIPRHLNTVDSLSSHFSRFGKIKICVIGYDNDPEAALVVFENSAAANAAYRNSEAIFNNRFIRLFWHNPDFRNSALQPLLPNNEVHAGGDHQITSSDQQVKEQSVNEGSVAKQESEKPVPPSRPFTSPDVERSVDFLSTKGAAVSRTPSTPVSKSLLKKCNLPSVASRKCKEEQQKEAMKKKYELLKKMQTTLECHLDNQKLFLEKLANSKSQKEKEFLKKAIEDLDQKIQVLKTNAKKISEEIMFKSGRPVVNKTETEKQLLDAEIDLYKMQHTGDESTVTELCHKVRELKKRATLLFENSGQGRGMRLPTRGGMSAFRGRGRGRKFAPLSRSVDHRPRTLKVVEPNTLLDKELLRSHFLQYGGIESFHADDTGVLVTFKTRKDAEMALALGSKFASHVLHMVWHDESSNAENLAKADIPDPVPEEEVQTHHNPLLEDDDEDEEDSEARSWRR